MNWITLIIAGLMEVAFTFCLGKTKTASAPGLYYWWGGFLVALTLSMYLMARAARTIPLGTVYPVWAGYRCCRRGYRWNLVFQRAGDILAHIL